MSDINRLLVVDDQADILDFVATVAELVGYRVATADNAQRAFALLREFDPSLVILDLQMPDMDGVEVIREFATYGTRAPILISSGMDPRVLTSVEQLGLTQGLNMIGTLQKPLSLPDLEAVLKGQLVNAQGVGVHGQLGRMRVFHQAGDVSVCRALAGDHHADGRADAIGRLGDLRQVFGRGAGLAAHEQHEMAFPA